jgi:hypothetical protein
MRRDGSTLSAILRDAWDRGDLSSLTKNSPARATGAHISVIGHITTDELRATLDRVAMANGSANRVLWLMVRRARVLPFGGALDDETIADLGRSTGAAISATRNFGRVAMTPEAKEAWRRVYPDLSAGRPGLLGAITNRAEAQGHPSGADVCPARWARRHRRRSSPGRARDLGICRGERRIHLVRCCRRPDCR